MALKSLRDVNQKAVAIVTLTALGAGCVFAFAIGQLHLFDRGYTMSGEFSDTAGLKKGQDVRVAGVKSGRITSVEPDFRHGKIIVTWHVNAGIDLGPKTRAEIQTTTLLGGRYLRLSGPVSKPYMADVPESRRRIPLDRTSVPFTVPDALEGAQNIVGKLDQKSIDKLLTEVNKIRSPGAAKLNRVLTNVQDLSRMLNDSYPQIQRLIESSKTITGTLASKDEQLREIINSSQVLLQALVRRRNELAATIGQGNRTVQTLSNVISKNQKQLDALLDNLHLLTTRLAPNMDALNTDFSLLGPTFQQVANLKGNGPWIEGVLTGLGPLQPPGPISTRRQGGN
ncbi:phospholipid/cholesterol/gamma-HCH transport system substrate-binding protein [Actinomadura meyerae]|jgi:phospholipid/cholesterol/gamma-HCH transport system substrate-binding protein|uniref:Phospholipid/cholesterol/gamma-HCH transport system substrate-binding protein n=1 Tax=Actinomadura meyerae TaxID=240840 RepID=A0A239I929_9ACTN|nr:MlaD family protein [Actinomadura meyerae]SNS90336.1 phospholipid/cholesterol/gamma-HCH transport system substrate-binding protein [Actinomadura meyerae]